MSFISYPTGSEAALPERTLWLAVLRQAFHDACVLPKGRERDEARHWLSHPSRDLTLVSALAGLSAEAVMARARALGALDGWYAAPPRPRAVARRRAA